MLNSYSFIIDVVDATINPSMVYSYQHHCQWRPLREDRWSFL